MFAGAGRRLDQAAEATERYSDVAKLFATSGRPEWSCKRPKALTTGTEHGLRLNDLWTQVSDEGIGCVWVVCSGGTFVCAPLGIDGAESTLILARRYIGSSGTDAVIIIVEAK